MITKKPRACKKIQRNVERREKLKELLARGQVSGELGDGNETAWEETGF